MTTKSPFTEPQQSAIKTAAMNFGLPEFESKQGVFYDKASGLIINSQRKSTDYKNMPEVGIYDGKGTTDENPDSTKMPDHIRDYIETAFKALPKKKFEPKVEAQSAGWKEPKPEEPKKIICNIVGCEDVAEQINTPLFSSGLLCRKHFDEINGKKDETKTETKIEDKTPEKQSEPVKEPEKKSAKPAKMCELCGTELSPKKAMECFDRDPQRPVFICNDCEGRPEPKEVQVMPRSSNKPVHKPDGLMPVHTVTQKGAIIKGFVPQLAELGKIKIGRKGSNTTGSGFRLPEKLDHFEIVTLNRDEKGDFIPDTIMKQLGETPRELRIMLLYNDETLCFSTRYNEYKGGKCMCSGDGETAIKRDGTKIECNPETCQTFNAKKCKLNGILSVILLDSPRLGGVYKFRTTGFNTVRSILSSLMFIKTVTGGVLAMIPLKLTVTPKMVQPKDSEKAHTIYVVNVEFAGTGEELLAKVIEVSKLQGAMRAEIQTLESKARIMLNAAESEEEIREVEQEFYPQIEVKT